MCKQYNDNYKKIYKLYKVLFFNRNHRTKKVRSLNL